jgi:hypothetical protein
LVKTKKYKQEYVVAVFGTYPITTLNPFFVMFLMLFGCAVCAFDQVVAWAKLLLLHLTPQQCVMFNFLL